MRAIRAAAMVCNLHIVQESNHRFRPQGITGYVLLEESHISIHTWPENKFAIVDVLSCKLLDINALEECLRDSLQAKSLIVSCHTRRRGLRSSYKK